MKRYFLLTPAILGCLFLAAPALAAPVSGDLIKASGSTIYYYGADGGRYVFPTEKTYFSWYADFASVKAVSDAELATYQLKGNVTYKPGTRLLKITTDPKVYAVSKNGVLRWVQTADIATALYGADWSKKVDDIPDAFFINYNIGTPIGTSADYSVMNESAVATINANMNIGVVPQTPAPVTPTVPTPIVPTPTPTAPIYNALIYASDRMPAAGSQIQLTARANPSNNVSEMKVFFNSSLVASCNHSPCTVSVNVPYGSTSTIPLRTEVSWYDSHQYSAASSIGVAGGTNLIILTVKPEVIPGGSRDVVVDVKSGFSAATIDIYFDGSLVRSCDSVQQCRYTAVETAATSSVHQIYSIIYDTLQLQQIQSDTQTETVVANDHPRLTFAYDSTDLLQGETTNINLSATDATGVASTEIWLDGQLLKHCDTTSCAIVAGPWYQTRSLSFIGKATDFAGLSNQATSTEIRVY